MVTPLDRLALYILAGTAEYRGLYREWEPHESSFTVATDVRNGMLGASYTTAGNQSFLEEIIFLATKRPELARVLFPTSAEIYGTPDAATMLAPHPPPGFPRIAKRGSDGGMRASLVRWFSEDRAVTDAAMLPLWMYAHGRAGEASSAAERFLTGILDSSGKYAKPYLAQRLLTASLVNDWNPRAEKISEDARLFPLAAKRTSAKRFAQALRTAGGLGEGRMKIALSYLSRPLSVAEVRSVKDPIALCTNMPWELLEPLLVHDELHAALLKRGFENTSIEGMRRALLPDPKRPTWCCAPDRMARLEAAWLEKYGSWWGRATELEAIWECLLAEGFTPAETCLGVRGVLNDSPETNVVLAGFPHVQAFVDEARTCLSSHGSPPRR